MSKLNQPRRQLLRLGFWVLYRHGGRIYDALARVLFGAAWDAWRRSVIALLRHEPVLDLGCGTGVLLDVLDRRGISSLGIDREPSMLGRAARHDGLRVVRAEAASLPIATGSVGSCVSTFPAPFILEKGVLDEVARVLRPGGAFVVLIGGRAGGALSARRRVLLRLVYGRDRDPALPDAALLSHESMPGRWLSLPTSSGQAIVWIAERRPAAPAPVNAR